MAKGREYYELWAALCPFVSLEWTAAKNQKSEFAREILGSIFQSRNYWSTSRRMNDTVKEVSSRLFIEDRAQTNHHDFVSLEIRVHNGVLYYAALWKSSKIDSKELWEKSKRNVSHEVFSLDWGLNFLQFSRHFNVRENRDIKDRFSPIRINYSIFINTASSIIIQVINVLLTNSCLNSGDDVHFQ